MVDDCAAEGSALSYLLWIMKTAARRPAGDDCCVSDAPRRTPTASLYAGRAELHQQPSGPRRMQLFSFLPVRKTVTHQLSFQLTSATTMRRICASDGEQHSDAHNGTVCGGWEHYQRGLFAEVAPDRSNRALSSGLSRGQFTSFVCVQARCEGASAVCVDAADDAFTSAAAAACGTPATLVARFCFTFTLCVHFSLRRVHPTSDRGTQRRCCRATF